MIFQAVSIIILCSVLYWFVSQVDHYLNVIRHNPKRISDDKVDGNNNKLPRLPAPSCTFRQYLRYIVLSTLPYVWSIPVKFIRNKYKCLYESELSNRQKRHLLANILLETSLTIGFVGKNDEKGEYYFRFEDVHLPCPEESCRYVKRCDATITKDKDGENYLQHLLVDELEVKDINSMFAFLIFLNATFTHPKLHAMCAKIADYNLDLKAGRMGVADTHLSRSINDMHCAIAGMNAAATYYPSQLLGVPVEQSVEALGINSIQRPQDLHFKFKELYKESRFTRFVIESMPIFRKHFNNTIVHVVLANTVMHSIDHYNAGKYFLQDIEPKVYGGIDFRTFSSIFVDHNFDLGDWQYISNSCNPVWLKIYSKLKEIDEELASQVQCFVCV